MRTKEFLQSVMQTAWQIFKVTGDAFASCLKKAWIVCKLKKAMRKGIVQFFYMKKDGTMRQAYGTTDPNRYEYEARGGRNGEYANCVQYYDTEKQGFRMFKTYNIISASV